MANNAQATLLPSEFECSCMYELSRCFGSLTFSESDQKKVISGAAPHLAPDPEGFTPLDGYGSTSITRRAPPMPMPTPPLLSGRRPYGAGVCFLRPKLTNQNLFVNPAEPQKSSSSSRTSARPGTVQWQQNQLFPVGLVGASRGTGVFHPQPTLASVNKNKTIRNKRETRNSRKEDKVTPKRNSSEVDGGLEKEQDEFCQHLLSEMGLPKEWTY